MRNETAMIACAALLSTLGCDRLLGGDDPAPAPVAPVAPPTVVIRAPSADGAQLFVDGHAAGALTDGQRLQLEPGVHAFEARIGDLVVARAERTLAAGEQVEVTLEMAATAPPPGPSVATDPRATPSTAPANGPLRGRVTLGDVTRESGAIPEAVAVRVLRTHLRATQSCYERLLETDRTAAGAVRARLTVRASGSLGSAEATEPAHDGLLGCVEAAARGATFPSYDEATVLLVPVTFEAVPTATPAAVPSRQAPTRSDVVAAMRAVTPAVRGCDGSGLVMVRFTFRGADGAVERVEATGSTPASVRSCVENAARSARLAPFAQPSFSVNYPFRL